MEPLIFIPPLDRASQKRIVHAHLMRGLLHWIDSARNTDAHPFSLMDSTGVCKQIKLWLPWKPLDIKQVTAQLYSELLRAARPWEDQTYDVVNIFNRCLRTASHHLSPQEFENWLAAAYFYYSNDYSTADTYLRYQLMTTADQSKLPADVMTRLQSTLGDLEATLLAKDPMMPQHLRSSHQILIGYPESVHLLTDDQVALLINAAQEHTKTMIVSAAAKKATVGKKPKAEKFDISEL